MAAATARQLDQLAVQLEPAFQRAFLKAVRSVANEAAVQVIADLMQAGRVDDVLTVLGLDEPRFADLAEALRGAFKAGGAVATKEMPAIRLKLDPVVTGSYRPKATAPVLRTQFDLRNPVAERWLQQNSARLITGIVNDQREVIRVVLQQGLAAGRNPRQTALELVGRAGATGQRAGGVVGLTSQQAQFVANMRAELASGDPGRMAQYFDRQRRDKRFDAAVRRAMQARRPVSPADIDKIAGRYADRLLALRGETIARAESITALSAGREESFRQHIAAGGLAPENVIGTWSATGDRRTRHTHQEMSGQKRAFGEPFVSPNGAQMMFPGDTSLGAPPEETINCRCTKLYRIDMAAEALRGQQVR
ncbi:hypothetical protein ARC20_03175 [Stenotrophomonas panacihumi]|uniref:Phage head morphogenesis domain-containing protein n=1 Tax=Stenotrophomonas panacihumi TaxID=676599 RepID=A0A0R0AY43_9GAMM|nr:phage minor head protein [Stenotrophomonas panacihumi]KRG47346.1 hypothetical protein ARC20_03175 [Stenotrophomonas panacihumi]PTN55823.1 head morphogenesis protein [Stenotrophomonas panacihumi]